MPKKTKEVVEDAFDWSRIPINDTEVKTKAEAFKEELKYFRKKMSDYVKEYYNSIYLQYDCNLKCESCHPVRVIECYLHNQEVNNLQKNGIKDVDLLINEIYKKEKENV